ncbi:MAG: DegT/DnrJ/EryC1/StrS family aminotransferase [Lachnospiraceae bacterium]|nr:DegT/DnrJ/EryC1/StrS family aminotransferase [Lachnospiraceae bacterium]
MDKILVTRSAMPEYEEYIEMIKPLWDSHWLTNMGVYHKELEAKLKEYMDVPQISLMVNGHMALEMAMQALDLPAGGEVITTPFTFISTTHAIIRNKLVPVFCDIKEDDYTIDENKIESLITEKTVAIVPVHVYGNICNVEVINEIAKRYNLKVIYDACHSFGEAYKGVKIGNFGDASVFSFHATKVFNTIEGGAVTFKTEELYERLYNLKNFGIRGEEHIQDVGANAKLNEFSAIMGLCNLRHVDDNIRLRKEKVQQYIQHLDGEEGITIQRFDQPNVVYNYGYFPVRFQNEEIRNKVYIALREQDIYARKYFYPLTADAECFRNKYKKDDLSVARRVSKTILVLPLYPELEPEHIQRICEIVKMHL